MVESIRLIIKPLRYQTSLGVPLETNSFLLPFRSKLLFEKEERGNRPGELRPPVAQLEIIGGFWLSSQVAFV